LQNLLNLFNQGGIIVRLSRKVDHHSNHLATPKWDDDAVTDSDRFSRPIVERPT
jgi:hypothetical protein